ncbi:FeoA family protein [Clostridium sp. DL1XJH146]
MPLAMVSEGREVVLVKIQQGKKLQKRLQDLGLVNGVRFSVVSNDMRGPFIIKLRDSKLVLGRGVAQKIFVEEEM